MELVKHETCQEYVVRRLSEGWRIAGSWRRLVFLSPPEGNFIRVVDLRNDVATLRPSAPGDSTQFTIGGTTPAATNWESVDEAIADEDVTLVNTIATSYVRDLYNLPALPAASAVASIKIYIRCKCSKSGYAKPCLKSDGTVTDGTEVTPGGWTTYSEQWNTNPADGGAWTKADIDALQIGVAAYNDLGSTSCTQVYVEVDYTPAPPPALENKSANMGSKMVAAGLI